MIRRKPYAAETRQIEDARELRYALLRETNGYLGTEGGAGRLAGILGPGEARELAELAPILEAFAEAYGAWTERGTPVRTEAAARLARRILDGAASRVLLALRASTSNERTIH